MPLLELKNVSKYYMLGGTRVIALENIDLALTAGEFSAVWGPSGSGKSTLLNIIATLDKPSEGRYTFAAQDTSRMDDPELTHLRQQQIGIIFQSFNLVPVLSALENVMLPLQFGGGKSKTLIGKILKERARYLLDEVGLSAKEQRRPAQLSGGEQQRVAIARALIAEPKLVLADEPTANLDSSTSELIIELLARLNRDHGTTFLFSTHHDLLIQAARRRLHLTDGVINNSADSSARILLTAQGSHA